MTVEPYICKKGVNLGSIYWLAKHPDGKLFAISPRHQTCDLECYDITEWQPYADFEREKLKELGDAWIEITDGGFKFMKQYQIARCGYIYESAVLIDYGIDEYCGDSESGRLLKRAEFLREVCRKEGVPWLDEAGAIPLSGGRAFACVDAEDYLDLSQHTWSLLNTNGKQYAVREEPMIDGKRGKQILMHRQILGAKEGQLCDHKDGNGLNNRRSNIRLATAAENARNTKKARGVSRFKGVTWDKRWNHWRVVIFVDGKQKYIGSFEDEIEAAKAYNSAANEYFREFAYLNEIPYENRGVEWLPKENRCTYCGMILCGTDYEGKNCQCSCHNKNIITESKCGYCTMGDPEKCVCHKEKWEPNADEKRAMFMVKESIERMLACHRENCTDEKCSCHKKPEKESLPFGIVENRRCKCDDIQMHDPCEKCPECEGVRKCRERDYYTRAEIDENLKKVLEVCRKRGDIAATCDEIIYVDKNEEKEWRKAVLNLFKNLYSYSGEDLDAIRKKFT